MASDLRELIGGMDANTRRRALDDLRREMRDPMTRSQREAAVPASMVNTLLRSGNVTGAQRRDLRAAGRAFEDARGSGLTASARRELIGAATDLLGSPASADGDTGTVQEAEESESSTPGGLRGALSPSFQSTPRYARWYARNLGAGGQLNPNTIARGNRVLAGAGSNPALAGSGGGRTSPGTSGERFERLRFQET